MDGQDWIEGDLVIVPFVVDDVSFRGANQGDLLGVDVQPFAPARPWAARKVGLSKTPRAGSTVGGESNKRLMRNRRLHATVE